MKDKAICNACGGKLERLHTPIRTAAYLAQWLGCSVEHADTLSHFARYYGRFCRDGCKRYFGFVSTQQGHVYRNINGKQIDFSIPAPLTGQTDELSVTLWPG